MSNQATPTIPAIDLLPLLASGKENIRGSHELAAMLGVNQRSIGFMVSKLRRLGHLVGSVPSKGYYMIENMDEYRETYDHIAGRKRGIDLTLEAMGAAALEQL